MCELIIGGGSCTNVASMTLINKLQVHAKVCIPLYILYNGSNKRSEKTTSKQALILFFVRPYWGEGLCDILSIDACQILVGKPWLFDNHVMYDGHANMYALKFKGRNLTLAPLPSPILLKFKLGRKVSKA